MSFGILHLGAAMAEFARLHPRVTLDVRLDDRFVNLVEEGVDVAVRIEEGRLLASLIPDSRFVQLDSENHMLLADEPAWAQVYGEVRDFLAERTGAGVAGGNELPFGDLTPLERAVVLAYYRDFARLPRPPTLEPRSHDEAANRVGRSRDSTRKAIERVNEKIAAAHDAPAIAPGRNVSAEIGRWLARSGILDPDLVQAE